MVRLAGYYGFSSMRVGLLMSGCCPLGDFWRLRQCGSHDRLRSVEVHVCRQVG